MRNPFRRRVPQDTKVPDLLAMEPKALDAMLAEAQQVSAQSLRQQEFDRIVDMLYRCLEMRQSDPSAPAAGVGIRLVIEQIRRPILLTTKEILLALPEDLRQLLRDELK
jgi:hypothetical protein